MEGFSKRKIDEDHHEESPSSSSFEVSKKPISNKAVHTSLFRRIVRYIPTNKKDYEAKKVPFFLLLVITILTGVVIYWAINTIYQYTTNFEMGDIFTLFSAELQQDEEERTNILLLGTGGGNHDGADLTDTIIIASINHPKQSISMMSIPRDVWVNLPGYGSSRINKVYDNLKDEYGSPEALEILRGGIENISGVTSPYYIKVDFAAFTKVIDVLGGVEVDVKKSIYDNEYPKEDQSGYEIFAIEAGTHVLDGKTALKYARSRHSTSDFDRAQRQQDLIKAIKRKVNEENLLTSPLTLKKLYEQFEENVETNLSVTEIVTLVRFGKNLDQSKLVSGVIKDIDVIDQGSFLYTPERELYGGAFVLRPLDESFSDIQEYISILFDTPEFFQESASIQVLNGTNRTGLAFRLGQSLIPYGFNIQDYDNADSRQYTDTNYFINRPENTQATESVINMLLPDAIKRKGTAPLESSQDFDVTIIVGQSLDLEEL